MQDRQLSAMEAVLKALADKTRLRILGLLAGGEVCVCHIHESLRIPQPKASRHLAYLKRAGLVVDRKDGLWVHYRLASPRDGVIGAMLSSVTHVLTHLPVTTKDRQRFEKSDGVLRARLGEHVRWAHLLCGNGSGCRGTGRSPDVHRSLIALQAIAASTLSK